MYAVGRVGSSARVVPSVEDECPSDDDDSTTWFPEIACGLSLLIECGPQEVRKLIDVIVFW